ncbi:hypothetical protein DFJ73DRAFT_761679 [Zopfochytrium polystomum]|nr:hypothetical protein DFJ73DRAFT_761679 [Zopfochytrium polystomum]
MPKSKRNKVVNLTKTEKKSTRVAKLNLIERVREASETHPFLHLLSISNMRNASLQPLREVLSSTSRIFFGKNRVVARALSSTSSADADTAPVTNLLKGNVGVCFSTLSTAELQELLDAHRVPYFAKAGVVAGRTVVIPEGKLLKRVEAVNIFELDKDTYGPAYLPTNEELEAASGLGVTAFPNNMETQLRALGMPTALKNGVILLIKPFTVCTEGQPLTPNQAHLLKHLNLMMATFAIDVFATWTKGELTMVGKEPSIGASGENGQQMQEDEEGSGDDAAEIDE